MNSKILSKKTPEITDEYESDWEIDELVNESILLNIKGEHERAIPLLNDLYRSTKDEKQRIRVLYGLYWLAFSNNRYKDAAEMADSIIMMQGRIAEELLNQSITEEQNNYYLQKAKDQQKQARIRTYALLIVIVVAILILGLLSIIFRLKIRANKTKLEAGIASLLNYKGQIEQIGIENKRLSSELLEQSQTIENLKKNVEYNSQFEEETAVILENMFREKWKTFNMLCSEYFKLDDTEQSKSVVLNNIAAELKKLKEKKSLKEIEHAVDKYMGGIMSMLREECAFLTEKDFQFLSLVYAGLSAKSTCLLTDSNPSSFYVKKNRISKRIATSNAPHLELFIRKLR